jgi:alpha-D-xyloside xylohydrolase
MMRPLVMDFRTDTNVFNIPDQFLFGPALMACPVTKSGATSRSVYVPAGTAWTDFWTGKIYSGGQTIEAASPIETMPLFVRAGSIIPYGPAIEYASQSADPIELRVYRGVDGAFTLYEDEGDNYNYEKGACATIPIQWNEAKQTLTIGKRQGKFPGMLKQRTFRVVWVSPGHGAGISATTTTDAVVKYDGTALNVRARN